MTIKKSVIVLAVLCFFASVLAAPDPVLSSKGMTAFVETSSVITVNPTTPKGFLDVLSADLFAYPKETTQQKLLTTSTNPPVALANNRYHFEWQKPAMGNYVFSVSNTVQTRFQPSRIKKKIEFPLSSLPSSLAQYLNSTLIITSTDPAIVSQANALASGETDLFVVVTKIADWTKNNVNYNLSSLTADISQNASWVFQNKQGVCDELTSLFIALLRAVGVPARFVSGISYTNSPDFATNWGAHGWAEVYFPDVGWVPFDVTFGEYGWIDAGHIKMNDGIDSKEQAAYVQWRGRDVAVNVVGGQTKARLSEVQSSLNEEVRLSVSPARNPVSGTSYQLAEVVIENLEDYYIAPQVLFASVNEIDFLNPSERVVILKPRERKKEFWLLKVHDLPSQFVYSIPLAVYTLKSETASANFTVVRTAPAYDRMSMEQEIEADDISRSRTKNALSLACSTPRTWMYEYESMNATCVLKTTGRAETVSVCSRSTCREVFVESKKPSRVYFPVPFVGEGVHSFAVRIQDSASSIVTVDLRTPPAFALQVKPVPASIEFGQQVNIGWTITQKSFVPARDARTVLVVGSKETAFNLATDQAQAFEVALDANLLHAGTNNLVIGMNWTDENGKQYSQNKNVSLFLEANWWQTVWLWVTGLFG